MNRLLVGFAMLVALCALDGRAMAQVLAPAPPAGGAAVGSFKPPDETSSKEGAAALAGDFKFWGNEFRGAGGGDYAKISSLVDKLRKAAGSVLIITLLFALVWEVATGGHGFGKVVGRFVGGLVLLLMYKTVFPAFPMLLAEVTANSGVSSVTENFSSLLTAGSVLSADFWNFNLFTSGVTALLAAVAQIAVYIVLFYARIMSLFWYCIGPFAVATIPLPGGGIAGKWFREFAGVCTWPLIAALVMDISTAFILGGAGVKLPVVGGAASMMYGLIMVLNAIAIPKLAGQLVGGGFSMMGAGLATAAAVGGAAMGAAGVGAGIANVAGAAGQSAGQVAGAVGTFANGGSGAQLGAAVAQAASGFGNAVAQTGAALSGKEGLAGGLKLAGGGGGGGGGGGSAPATNDLSSGGGDASQKQPVFQPAKAILKTAAFGPAGALHEAYAMAKRAAANKKTGVAGDE